MFRDERVTGALRKPETQLDTPHNDPARNVLAPQPRNKLARESLVSRPQRVTGADNDEKPAHTLLANIRHKLVELVQLIAPASDLCLVGVAGLGVGRPRGLHLAAPPLEDLSGSFMSPGRGRGQGEGKALT